MLLLLTTFLLLILINNKLNTSKKHILNIKISKIVILLKLKKKLIKFENLINT